MNIEEPAIAAWRAWSPSNRGKRWDELTVQQRDLWRSVAAAALSHDPWEVRQELVRVLESTHKLAAQAAVFGFLLGVVVTAMAWYGSR